MGRGRAANGHLRVNRQFDDSQRAPRFPICLAGDRGLRSFLDARAYPEWSKSLGTFTRCAHRRMDTSPRFHHSHGSNVRVLAG
jgi:hypothetical protein